jgi:hypothetical protein
VRDLPHSKQHAFNRDVINPQDGHILCDPYPGMCGFSLCILWSSRIVSSTISRPKEKLVAFIGVLLLGDCPLDLVVANKGRVPCRGPSFLSVAQWDRREERCPGRSTERCERDSLRLVLRVSNSNEIRERTAMIERSKGLHDWPIRCTI